jgi:hypothetical protein
MFIFNEFILSKDARVVEEKLEIYSSSFLEQSHPFSLFLIISLTQLGQSVATTGVPSAIDSIILLEKPSYQQ